ncbi:G-protein alpha subunit [Trametes maxima]|nr:G-protein alpha subunit [Trametes maxima]
MEMQTWGPGRTRSGSRGGTQHERQNAWPPYPPPGETELERAMRVEEEREAKRISDAIDRELEAERQALRKDRKGKMKLLLLGQSESGKSTMLKNFQIHFAPNALRAESAAWRAVIHLNLVRAVNFILDVLTRPPPSPFPAAAAAAAAPAHPASAAPPSAQSSSPSPPDAASPTVHAFPPRRASATPQPNSDLRRYKLSLSPLKQVEMILVRHLSATSSPFSSSVDPSAPPALPAEVTVRGGSAWRALLRRQQAPHADGRTRFSEGRADEVEHARQILDACRADVAAMWASAGVRAALREEGVVVEDHSAFFLDHADRVAQMDYEPTFDDILRARLQTIGVEEHHLSMETSAEDGQRWIFYDVGGARGQRASWVPFFEDMNAIIFLCSTAAFNEVLSEDRAINRLLDSFNTWKTICSSRLLTAVQFILLLNKMDLLDAKLRAGVQFAHSVKSYRGENELVQVTEYLRRKFAAIHHHHSPQPRKLHVHTTCAIDIVTTSSVLLHIRDTILVNYLTAMQVM